MSSFSASTTGEDVIKRYPDQLGGKIGKSSAATIGLASAASSALERLFEEMSWIEC